MTRHEPPFRWSRAAEAGLRFRPITDADLPFLARLYASTRMEELAVTDWPDPQKTAFLQSQFDVEGARGDTPTGAVDATKQPTVEIETDRDAEYEVLAKVLSRAKNANLAKISFVEPSAQP